MMMNLSSESLSQVAYFLRYNDEQDSFNNFRKCCYSINSTIVCCDMHKVDAYDLTLYMSYSKREMSTTIFDNNWDQTKKTISELQQDKNLNEGDVVLYLGDETAGFLSVKPNLLTRRRLQATEQSEEIIKKEASVLKRLLEATIHNLSSVQAFRIENFILDTEFLNVIKEYEEPLSYASQIEIEMCDIKWTSDELLEFLEIFDSLSSLKIYAQLDNATIITNEHLCLVSDIIEIKQFWIDVYPYFPEITSAIVDYWMEKKMNFVIFEGISTGLSYSDLKKYIDVEIDNARLANDDWFRLRGTFSEYGSLKFSENDLRKIALDQRKRKFNWKITSPVCRNIKIYKITGSGVKYSFMMDIPYQSPNFRELLENVEDLHARVNGLMDIDENEQEEVQNEVYNIRKYLYEYKRFNKLIDEVIEAEPQNENENPADDNAHNPAFGWNANILRSLRVVMNEIRHRIRQLEAAEG